MITDVVSSDTLPVLDAAAEESLAALLLQLSATKNFFQGTNPAALSSAVAKDPVLAADLAGPETAQPWRWDIGSRLYLVWALRWRKQVAARNDDLHLTPIR